MKRDFIFSLAIFFGCLAVDQLTKRWGLTLSTLHYNEGLIFGLYSGLPKYLRTITLSSVFGFIFFSYVMLLYLLPSQLTKLKYGLSFLVGGIFGNVVDRTIYARSIDFIPLPLWDGSSIIFNIADVLQWIGAIIIVYKIITKEKIIWHPDNQRGKYLINPKEQLRLAFTFMGIAYCSSLLLGIFCFSFVRTTLLQYGVQNPAPLLQSFGFAYLSLSIVFSLCVFAAGVVISHRTAGPFYAFEIFVADLLRGKKRDFVLRDGDHYKHLEIVASELKQYMDDKEKKPE